MISGEKFFLWFV